MNEKLFPIMTETDKELPYYLMGVGLNWEQEHVNCPNGYHYQWIQCIRGEGELITSGKTYRVKEGSGMLLMKGIPHEYYAVTPNWIVEWVVFDGSQVEAFLHHIGKMKNSGAYYVSRPEVFSARIRSLMDIEQSESSLKSIKCSSLIYSLLTDIVQYASLVPNNNATNLHYKLKPLFSYIDENYASSVTLEDLAKVIQVTPSHLCVLFKRITNIRIFQYINSYRIKKSKELLIQNPQMPIKEVAISVGFEDVNYYCSVFKKQENLTPGQFRKLYIS